MSPIIELGGDSKTINGESTATPKLARAPLSYLPLGNSVPSSLATHVGISFDTLQ